MSDELKPCPFCGGSNLGTGHTNPKVGEVKSNFVVCGDCHAYGPYAASQEEANAAWNRRAATWPAGDEAAEQLARAWQDYTDIIYRGRVSPKPPSRMVRDTAAAVLDRLNKGEQEGGEDA